MRGVRGGEGDSSDSSISSPSGGSLVGSGDNGGTILAGSGGHGEVGSDGSFKEAVVATLVASCLAAALVVALGVLVMEMVTRLAPWHAVVATVVASWYSRDRVYFADAKPPDASRRFLVQPRPRPATSNAVHFLPSGLV